MLFMKKDIMGLIIALKYNYYLNKLALEKVNDSFRPDQNDDYYQYSKQCPVRVQTLHMGE